MDQATNLNSRKNYIDMRLKAKKLLQRVAVERLSSLPHLLLHALDTCQGETFSLDQITALVEKDPALYIKMVSLVREKTNTCNTANNLIETLQDIEPSAIKSVIVSSAVQQFFSRHSHERTDFLKQFWRHSLLCAYTAESIAKLTGYKLPNEAFHAGLLHDIGQLVLENIYPGKYTSNFAQLSEDEYFHDLEYEEFGTTHYVVGAELFHAWKPKSFIADAIFYHHEPVDKIVDAHPLVKIINLANLLSSDSFGDNDETVYQAGEKLLGLSSKVLSELIGKSNERVNKLTVSLGIDVDHDITKNDVTQQQVALDQLKQVQLAERVRNIAMLNGIHQHFSAMGDKTSLLNAIQQQAGLLFGLHDSLVFIYDSEKNVLCANATNDDDAHLNELSVTLEKKRSLIADALLIKKVLCSFDNENGEIPVFDQQVIGITGRDGLLALPMIVDNQTIGALVVGVDKFRYPLIQKQRKLLNQFSNEVAQTINTKNYNTTGGDRYIDKSEILEAKVREIVHEVRNPLSIMNNYLEILSYKLENDNPAFSDLQTLKGEIGRISSILQKLTEPDEIDVSETTQVDVNTLIADLTHVFQTSLFATHSIRIILKLDEQLPHIITSPNAIKQIYTNLIKNAVEALPANGEIMVYTHDQVNVDGIEHIEIAVNDDGPGISRERLAKLFSPIQTSKGGDHAGLGLTIVKNLVNELNGSIHCKSSENGTGFHVLLPKITIS